MGTRGMRTSQCGAHGAQRGDPDGRRKGFGETIADCCKDARGPRRERRDLAERHRPHGDPNRTLGNPGRTSIERAQGARGPVGRHAGRAESPVKQKDSPVRCICPRTAP